MATPPSRIAAFALVAGVFAPFFPHQALAAGDAKAESKQQSESKAQCISAYERGQKLKQESKLSRAREQLILCMREGCPALLRSDCEQWFKEVEEAMPSVVIDAKSKGADVTDVKVRLDGALVAERLDGTAIQVDPGNHVFVFEAGQGPRVEQRVLIRVGEKNRPIHVTFAAEDKVVQKPPASRPIPVLTWVFGGLGVAALGSFAYFGLTGKSEADDYQSCKPYCDQGEVDRTHNKLIAADVSLGVGVVSLGVATYLLLTRPEQEAGPSARIRLHAVPMLGGGMAGVSSSF